MGTLACTEMLVAALQHCTYNCIALCIRRVSDVVAVHKSIVFIVACISRYTGTQMRITNERNLNFSECRLPLPNCSAYVLSR
jgi:hypothetical protein